ncbi:MAG TPA: tetratricopeptide repeat protein, partial [Terracidiphilus sp.]|nr:tetratricopeptide repeat protein [Terracidiphilus sp.]
MALLSSGYAQQRPPTIRHHRVEEPAPKQTFSPEVEQAEAAMQRNDFTGAEALLQKATAAKPDDYRAWFDLGYVYNAMHKPAEAIEAYRRSVAAKSDVFESNFDLGLLLAKQGDSANAAKYLSAATHLKPANNSQDSLARAWQALGEVQEASNPHAALADFAEAAKLVPTDAGPHLASAALLRRQGDLEAALREYQAAAHADPHSADAQTGLAEILIAQKKYAEAEFALRDQVTRDVLNNAARAQLGRVLALEGKNDEAAVELKKATQGGVDPEAALELGTLYVKADNDADAEPLLRQAVAGFDAKLKAQENDPNAGSRAAEAHAALGALLLHEKKYPEAQKELLTAVRLKPDLADAYSNLAVAASSNQQYELTLRALDERAKYLPESPATA